MMLRIALVEDSPAEAYLLERALRQTGAEIHVRILHDGLEAIEEIGSRRNEYDMVLLDLNLPRLSGFEVLERLRQEDEFKSLPIVVLSGSGDPVDIERCYRAGANSYVCKPSHLEEVFVTATQLMAYWSHCVKLPPKRLATVAGTRPA